MSEAAVPADRRAEAFASDIERESEHREKAKSLGPLLGVAPFLKPYRALIAVFLFFLVLASALSLSVTLAGRLMIDCGFAAEPQAYCADAPLVAEGLSGVFRLGLLISVALGVASAARFYFVSRIGERVVADLRKAVFDHLTTLPPAAFEALRTGEILSRLTTDTTLIQTAVGSSASVALRTVATTGGALILMLLTNWKLTLMVAGIAPLVLAPIIVAGRRIRTFSRDAQDRLADASARAGETFGAISTMQAFTREPEERARFADAAESAFDAAHRRIRARSLMTAIAFSLGLAAMVCVLWFGASEVQSGAATGGAMAQFALLAIFAVSGAGVLTETWAELLRASGAAGRIAELLAMTPEISAPANPSRVAQERRGEVRFEGVSFAYPTRPEDAALSDVSFEVASGETVALVGPSGAGKSTVFQLLLRFYDPSAGRVLIDDVDIARLDPRDLRSMISVVEQNAPLFSGTVRDNIAYGRPEAGDEEIRAAAEAANAADFVADLPGGFDAEIGPSGVRLSGGQRQRIAIARAVLRDAPLLLLDEATSALDAESERAVQDAFATITKRKTTLVIAHRLATVRSADRIVVLDQGRVVETGRHDELTARGGLYARLARLQFEEAA
ncbi:MAG: ABC transporter transmembrane domain-containing protein [Pseudomonadota bacterium]